MELDQDLASHQATAVHMKLDTEGEQNITYHLLILKWFKTVHLVIRVQAGTPAGLVMIIFLIVGCPGCSPLSYNTRHIIVTQINFSIQVDALFKSFIKKTKRKSSDIIRARNLRAPGL